jgi:hypothetical protein
MALLPAKNILDGSKLPATTTGEMKSALGTLRDFLFGLLGGDSTDTAGARAALGAAPIVPNMLSKNVAGGATVTLTTTEALNDVLNFTGLLTANIEVDVPALAKQWIARNSTTGNFTLTFKTAAGAGVVLAQGKGRPVYCDGVDVISAMTDFTDNPAPTVPPQVWARQAINSGPVDSNGFFAPGGSTGSASLITTAISPAAPLVVNAAGGNTATGGIGDRIGVSAANLTFTGLTTNGTMYLFGDVAANGAISPGASAIAPNYQRGGTFSITTGQFTYNSNVKMQTIGTGAAAVQSYRVYLGEVTVAGNVVTALIWYRINNKYDSAQFANPNTGGSASNLNINLGLPVGMIKQPQLKGILTAPDSGWPSGTMIFPVSVNTSTTFPLAIQTRNLLTVQAGASGSGFVYQTAAGGVTSAVPAACNFIVTAEGDL